MPKKNRHDVVWIFFAPILACHEEEDTVKLWRLLTLKKIKLFIEVFFCGSQGLENLGFSQVPLNLEILLKSLKCLFFCKKGWPETQVLSYLRLSAKIEKSDFSVFEWMISWIVNKFCVYVLIGQFDKNLTKITNASFILLTIPETFQS